MALADAMLLLRVIPRTVFGVRFDLLIGIATITCVTLTPIVASLGEWMLKVRSREAAAAAHVPEPEPETVAEAAADADAPR